MLEARMLSTVKGVVAHPQLSNAPQALKVRVIDEFTDESLGQLDVAIDGITESFDGPGLHPLAFDAKEPGPPEAEAPAMKIALLSFVPEPPLDPLGERLQERLSPIADLQIVREVMKPDLGRLKGLLIAALTDPRFDAILEIGRAHV